MLLSVSAKTDTDWLVRIRDAVRYAGCAVVTDVLDPDLVQKTRAAMYQAQERIHEDVGQERLSRAGEIGVLRLMPRYDSFFLELLTVPEMVAVVDEIVSETAILHLQNGFILPPQEPSAAAGFQHTFHRDFPRHLHGYVASLNVMLTLDEFTEQWWDTCGAGDPSTRGSSRPALSGRRCDHDRVPSGRDDRLRFNTMACRWDESI